MSVSWMPYIVGRQEKDARDRGPTPEERKLANQIDTLQRMGNRERDKHWGENWTQEMVDFHDLNYFPSVAAPSYRPRVILPELQFLLMSEATELTNDSPKVYISVNGKRDEGREKAFAALWKLGKFNNRIFDAVLWSQYANPACLQVGFDANARMGKGMIWLRARDPDTFAPDPHAKNDFDWSFTVAEDWFYVDDVRRNWPEQGWRVKVGAGYDDYEEDEATGSGFDLSLELPPGPLRVDSPDGFEHQRNGPRVRVRYCFVKDYAREVVREIAGERTAQGIELLVRPEKRWKYPYGRFIVECQGIKLADGPNWCPKLPQDDFSTFPFLGVWSLPHLKSYYGPPPIRYGKGAQDIAERMYTQLIENMIRTNNGQAFIPEESGIDIDAYGGLPGEVLVYRGEKTPEIKWPNAIPQHMTQIPEILIQKVARYVGWTPERQGQAGQGNISPELFDAALFQSQSLLRMKARLLSETYHRLTALVFAMMVKFKTIEDRMRPPRGKDSEAVSWSPVPQNAEVDMELDETSIDALSSAQLRNLVVALGKLQLVPSRFVLETLNIPNAEEISEQATRQAELSALARLKKPR
jgi:hypothetical protein